MQLPSEVPVMILANATLFPQALLPLYIFEPRYRRMLADSLASHRMFAVAMQRPNATREQPEPIAGLGLVRVSVEHGDSTSHLILQGIARIQLREAVRYKPYRKHRVELMNTPLADSAAVELLVARLRQLLQQRAELGLPFPFPVTPAPDSKATKPSGISPKDVLKYLEDIRDPEQLVDLVSCAVLPDALERQCILETASLESRLRQLIKYVTLDIRRCSRKSDAD
ncbi:MAG: hypothetical protein RLY20_2858 [Verrucomicrobiota bacterium]|jgi:ATP-dependent Lon protease